ncbi:S58 family peptidase [Bremerella cremea]|uniref:Aminopeptidase n=1 Tax=Blastopirellula marina TaxID=124 RepID=A0A2S8FY95_9BACT|nr:MULTISPECIES: P1 family peptidase [Pirellulaceae]PQO37159.1 aminopeptidase [Blastopirellula marina]RCS49546.1 S58 family peptidase [Bremerella cremea]
MHLRVLVLLLSMMVSSLNSISADEPDARPRTRDLGIAPGVFKPGKSNAITDVAGVKVGQVTLIDGKDIRTGVTAILPHEGNLFQQKTPAAVFIGNAFGKLAGSTQVEELGNLETPIILTNTLSVGTAVEAVVKWSLTQPGNENVRSVNALVGETNDGGLNDIRGQHVRGPHVVQAIEAAQSGIVEEGCVGAGTGCIAFGWKGGIGTSSRTLPQRYGGYTVGVLVQANFGGVLQVDGLPVGKVLGKHTFAETPPVSPPAPLKPGDGSCMIVVATDAPLDPRNLKRLAARALFGLARTGSSYTNGSGDFAIAFSTNPDLRVAYGEEKIQTQPTLPNDAVSPLFQAALETTEEAVYNALLKATPMQGRDGRKVEALPLEPLRALIEKREQSLAE